MMIVLHPTYTLRVTVKDPYMSPNQQGAIGIALTSDAQMVTPRGHKYFDSQNGKTGCDEALAAVKSALSKAGIEADVWLDRFEHKS